MLVEEDLLSYLESGDWESLFAGGILAEARKLVGGKLVSGVEAEFLDTGDAELRGSVSEKSGSMHQATIAFWTENGELQLDASCDCAVGQNCVHAAALIGYLLKAPAERFQSALGQTPDKQVEKMTGGKTLVEATPAPAPKSDAEGPAFLFRVEKTPRQDDGTKYPWLPDVGGHAFAVYGQDPEARVPLETSGNLPAIDLDDGTQISRNRAAEMDALTALYAMAMRPDAHRPPQSLKKIATPAALDDPTLGTLWSPDRKEWPDPAYFWKRFRHEGTAALERRGWEVQFAPDVGGQALVFNTETWRAEIVEEGAGWFHLSAGFEIDGEPFALQPILAALVANDFLNATEGMPKGQEFMVFLPDGRGLALPVGRFRRILTVLTDLLEFPFSGGNIRITKMEAALLLAEDAGEESDDESGFLSAFEAKLEAAPQIEALAERVADFTQIEPVDVPVGLEATLREYQLDGYHWMQFLATYGLHGILADDMGLGKTLQGLCHILAEKESGRSQGRPSLVMAPTSVVVNWQREAEKFTPGLEVLVLQGPKRREHFDEMGAYDIVLTSYALLPRDLEAFLDREFHLFLLDEAQHIKNRTAQVSEAVRQIDAQHRLCLSGTPVENHLGELWSLMDFLMPGHLGGHDHFTSTYRTPIEKNGDREKAEALAKRVGPLILRRTKNDVAKELPPKTEILHSIQLEGDQQDLYETVRSTMDKQVRQALAIRGTDAQIMFLDALLKLRQICCHPRLLEDRENENPTTPTGTLKAAKFDYLCDLLTTLRSEGHRVLLFSQFTSMLSIIEAYLEEVESPFLKRTGATKDRQDLVERWQGGEGEVFLISLKAGGTGLTLTGADTVIHYDPWWNPAAENQATDRAYRIGQDKPVFVHKLICEGTVEERIQQMQAKKGGLADDLLSGALQNLGRELNAKTMAELLG